MANPIAVAEFFGADPNPVAYATWSGGTNIQLRGTNSTWGSNPSDTAIGAYKWDLMSAPTGHGASFDDDTSGTPTLQNIDTAGNYVIGLVVTTDVTAAKSTQDPTDEEFLTAQLVIRCTTQYAALQKRGYWEREYLAETLWPVIDKLEEHASQLAGPVDILKPSGIVRAHGFEVGAGGSQFDVDIAGNIDGSSVTVTGKAKGNTGEFGSAAQLGIDAGGNLTTSALVASGTLDVGAGSLTISAAGSVDGKDLNVQGTPQVYKYTLNYNDASIFVAALNATKSNLPAMSATDYVVVHDAFCRVTTAWAGGGIATCTMELGTVGGTVNEFLGTGSINLVSAGFDGQTNSDKGASLDDVETAIYAPGEQPELKVTATGDNLDQATQGVVEIFIVFSRLP